MIKLRIKFENLRIELTAEDIVDFEDSLNSLVDEILFKDDEDDMEDDEPRQVISDMLDNFVNYGIDITEPSHFVMDYFNEACCKTMDELNNINDEDDNDETLADICNNLGLNYGNIKKRLKKSLSEKYFNDIK